MCNLTNDTKTGSCVFEQSSFQAKAYFGRFHSTHLAYCTAKLQFPLKWIFNTLRIRAGVDFMSNIEIGSCVFEKSSFQANVYFGYFQSNHYFLTFLNSQIGRATLPVV